ncbi:septum formation inhibitor Maf [Anabaena cylindrica FACHB-243]|uniref:Nucleoside triphosphate pyrophosphatase n=1 Tax=Anabaena cylindrica (strain ATCC 27899 / PCC 7122) TaxID=272123 RepID=K9ZND9_ANACC|nr:MULTISPECIES: nucleoside triphosphate pyrophosphatase [Anabaena]AFZ59845.1 Septum formation protein Maf [Anabaena cylindrica PCC 7122]MBD2417244.1 septum formation inhibitor Maf [Anabaena cylindrica FACHB-243]MBY5282328.1 septum formation inhibitor Maf [Anabaena sp. CCAP 1446/1C]MBY5309746.1 septum formation inhibitor Maf [Anabaena sp. CCAP 1446/1C]MCM2404939.1 Maf-like protein [Anabaena sp. CCAP 1446/1C]
MTIPEFILASASPARRRLLQTVGIEPRVCPSDFDESQIQLSDPAQLVQTLAQCKAETVVSQFASALIMGCDSVLAMNGEIYGKPADAEEAIARWQLMQGNFGDLYTGHVLIDTTQNRSVVKCQVTRVFFGKMSDRAIQAYVATGEPLKCAGAFAIEGFGSLFVEKIEGCHSNVIGLSLPLLRQMIGELGYEVTDFWG